MKKKQDKIVNIVLFGFALILVGYLIYDKVLMRDSESDADKINKASENSAYNETEIGINGEMVVQLSNYLSSHSKLNGSYDDSWVYLEDFYNYTKDEVTYSDLGENEILEKAFWYLYRIDKLKVSDINKEKIEYAIKMLYGKKETIPTHKSFSFDVYDCVYTEDYVCSKTTRSHSLLEKANYRITKAVQTNSDIIISEYFYYPEYVDGKWNIYNTSDKEKKIATLTNDEYKKTDIISKYKDDLYLFKHYYKATGTGSYYWYSTKAISVKSY